MKKIIEVWEEWKALNKKVASCPRGLISAQRRRAEIGDRMSLERIRHSLVEVMAKDVEDYQLHRSEHVEISAVLAGDVGSYEEVVAKLSQSAKECLIDWVNIYGYPKGSYSI